MNAHELAQKLLNGPDVPVVYWQPDDIGFVEVALVKHETSCNYEDTSGTRFCNQPVIHLDE